MLAKPSWKNPTIGQIAAEAKVSTATADRVLNGRPGVREATRKKVEAALFRLGKPEAVGELSPEKRRIAFICEAGSGFLTLVEKEARALIAARPDISFTLDSVPNVQVDADRFSLTITRRARECEAIILVSRDHLKVNRAVREAVDNGVHVICLSTDLPNSRRSAYIGIDQISTGATAGWFMGRLLPQQSGNILLVYSSTYRTQEEREVGFRRVLREQFPWLNVVERVNINDESDGAYQSVKKFLASNPPMVGIYNMAGGNRGVARALKEYQLQENVIFIGHELSEESRLLLESGEMDIVLGHDIRTEIQHCLELVNRMRRGEAVASVKTPLHVFNRYSYFP
ncbi:LacI family DNA-binding transcriptional regulator [Pantoea sp. A4]|uniref:LacI family DNA-binding transcriptional regulator n=1 Tax=Pantoea sp. A4 TaxID=1225184 RepID=UPI00037ADBDC|nr:LacI family DNA-binding transcriptional regulator [Pantoea sp. A4]